jgi:hypothetical protein
MKKTTQGFAHLGLLLLVLVVAVVAFAGYKVAKSHSDNTSNSATKPATAQVIPAIKNTADLNAVETTLNNQNIDSNLNPDSLNQDVDALL